MSVNDLPKKNMFSFKDTIFKFKTILIIYVVIVSASTIIKFIDKPALKDGVQYTNYNNYIIFKNSFVNLINHSNLYIQHLDKQWDLYKYSPSFAACMSVFSLLPDFVGLLIWNLVNCLSLLFVIRLLPIDDRKKQIVLLLIFFEVLTSILNSQSNCLVGALFVGSFVMLERKNYFWATLFTVLNMSIKVFGVLGFLVFLFYPKKWKAFFYTILWTVVVFSIPLLFIKPMELLNVYKDWFVLLKADSAVPGGLSIYGWLQLWFHLGIPNNIILGSGVALLVASSLRFDLHSKLTYRILILSSVLMWVVLFNHKAESPTFVIAMTGISLWFVTGKSTLLNRILIILAIVFITLSPTDIFPRYIRNHFFRPYSVKVVPLVLIWFVLTYQILSEKLNFNTKKGYNPDKKMSPIETSAVIGSP